VVDGIRRCLTRCASAEISATVIVLLGALVVAVFGALCLGVPALRHGTGLEICFAVLSATGCALILLRALAVERERAAW